MKIKDITPFVNGSPICSIGYIKNRNINRTLKKVFEKYYRIGRNSKSKTIAHFLTSDEVTPYQNAALLYNPDKDTKLTSIFNFLTHKIKITVKSDKNTPSLEALWKVEMVFSNHADVFGWEEVGEDVATESFLKDLFKPTTYLKLNKSYDIFNTISQAVIKASNGKKAYLPIKKVDEIYLVNRLLLQTPFAILRLRIKKSKVFYKPKHLEDILRDFELKHVMSNDENSMFKSLLNPRPHIRKHIYGTRLDHPIIGVGDKEIPIKALTPVDMERIMKEAGSIRKVSCGDKPTTEETTKQEDTLSPFYSFISPDRRVMFQNAMNEIDSMLSMALDTSKTKLSDVERMADIVYPCITKAVKEFRMNKQENDYYVVFCTGTDTVESFSVNDNELEKRLSVLKETQQHKFLDLSNLSRIPVVKEECKELTTELLNFVLDKLPSAIVNKVVRIVFNISFLDKYRDEYIKTNDKQLFFGIGHVFRKPGFDTESYINFKQCDLSNFMLETNSGILKLKVKGEI